MLKKPKFKTNIKKLFAYAGLAVLLASLAFNFVPTRVGVPALPVAKAAVCDLDNFVKGPNEVVKYDKTTLYGDEWWQVYLRMNVTDAASQTDCVNQTFTFRMYGSWEGGAGAYFPGCQDRTVFEKEVAALPVMQGGRVVAFDSRADGRLQDMAGVYSKKSPQDALKDIEKCTPRTLVVSFKMWQQTPSEDSTGFSARPKIQVEKTSPGAKEHTICSGAGCTPGDQMPQPEGVGSGVDTGRIWARDKVPLKLNKIATIYRFAMVEKDGKEQPYLPVPYNMDWGEKDHPVPGSLMMVGSSPKPLKWLYLGLNFDGAKIDCNAGNCKDAKINEVVQEGGKGFHTQLPADGEGRVMRAQLVTTGVKSAYDGLTAAQKASTDGKPFTTLGMVAFGVFDVSDSNGITLPNGAPKFTVEFYATEAQAVAACKAENAAKTNCDSFEGWSQGGQEQNVTTTADKQEDPSNGCSSGALLCFLSDVIIFIVKAINELLYFLFYYLIAPVISAMLSIHTFSDTFVQVIYPGWEIMRNVCNIFFILALLIIALATVFGVKGYQYKSLLLNLLIAALFVNFSLVIGQAVLGLTETVQSQFLNPGIVRQLGKSLMYDPIFQSFPDKAVTTTTATGRLIRPIMYLFLAFGSFIVMAMIAWALFRRMIALWIYYMISPLAWAAGALPATAKYRSQWWDGFLKNALFVPALAFFLNIAALLAQKQGNILDTITTSSFKNSTNPTLTALLFQVAGTLVIIIFLKQALAACEGFGTSVAGSIVKTAQRGFTNPFGMTKDGFKKAKDVAAKVGKYSGANWAADRVFGGTKYDPREWNRIRKERNEEKKKKRLEDRRAKSEPFIKRNYPFNKDNLKRWGNVLKYDMRYPRNRHKTLTERAEYAEDRLKLMDSKDKQDLMDKAKIVDAEKKEKEDEIKELDVLNVRKLTGDEITKRMQTQEKNLDGQISSLQQSYLKSTDPDQRKALKDEIDKLTNLRTAIAAKRIDMYDEINRTGRADASLKAVASDPVTGKYFRESILDPLKAEYQGIQSAKENEYKELEDKIKPDDDLRKDFADRYKKFGFKIDDVYDDPARQADMKARDYYRGVITKTTEPESHYDRQLMRQRINEAKKKNADIEDDGERLQLMSEARARGNSHEFLALLEEQSKDGNTDSVLKHFGFDVTYKGKQEFYEKMGKEFKIPEQQMRQIMVDNTKKDVSNGFVDLGGVAERKKGKIELITDEKEHVKAAVKKTFDDPRQTIKSKKGNFYLAETASGKPILHAVARQFLTEGVPRNATYLNEFNVAAARAIVKVPDWEVDPVTKKSLPDHVIKAIRAAAGK